jgi:hypothetical protein
VNNDTLIELRNVLRDFAAARDWEQFHTPKNLATALSVEAAELLEHLQTLLMSTSVMRRAEKSKSMLQSIQSSFPVVMQQNTPS